MGRYSQDSGGGDFVQAPPGTHVARCVRLIDLGTQHSQFEGRENVRNQVFVQWELVHETYEYDGRPVTVGKFYTNSLNEKANLRKDLESWRSRPFTEEEKAGFDLEAILGKPCMVAVIHNDAGKAKVTSVSAMPRGMECPPAQGEISAFWIEPWDEAAYQALGDGFKRMISESDEFKGLAVATTPATNGSETTQAEPAPMATLPTADDDIPF